MVLIPLIRLLDKGQTAQQAAQPVDDHGPVIRTCPSLEGTHRVESKKISAIAPKQFIKRNSGPGLPDYLFGKRPIQCIGMSQTAIFDSGQMALCNPSATVCNAAEKEGIPVAAALKEIAGFSQSKGISTLKEDIVLEDEHVPSLLQKPLIYTAHMGLENSLFRIIRMFGDDNKLDPRQNTQDGKLLFYLMPPVRTAVQGDAVDPVEKGPAGVRFAFW